MPEFAKFTGESGNDLSNEDNIRAIRFMIAAEYEAIQLYTQFSATCNDNEIVRVLNDIITEEKIHVGEFMQLLFTLDPSEQGYYAKGMEEAEETIQRGNKYE